MESTEKERDAQLESACEHLREHFKNFVIVVSTDLDEEFDFNQVQYGGGIWPALGLLTSGIIHLEQGIKNKMKAALDGE